MLVFELAVVGCLILLNGFFAMSELAVVSSRKGRLQQMAQTGSRGARRAIKLVEDPTGFLSTVQIGITLVGVLAGAYSGATLAQPLGDQLAGLRWLGASADELAFAIVVIAITYLSLIVGELVPKRLALANAEGIASFVAPILSTLARIGAPMVWLLRVSTEAVLGLLRVKREPGSTVTEEEVKSLIAEGTTAGVFEPAEQNMIYRVLRLADRPARSIMVPRPDVVWLDVEDPANAILDEVRDSGHSRFPVARGDVDQAIGVVHAKDLLEQQRRSGTLDIAAVMREPLYVNDSMPILKLLDRFRASNVHMALVLDEHGTLEGIVTPLDILTAIAGDLPERGGEDEPDAVQRQDGSWLLDGRMAIDEVERLLSAYSMAGDGDYATLAGFVLHQLGHIPTPGEHFAWQGWRFEVVDLDRRRIDKVMASPIAAES